MNQRYFIASWRATWLCVVFAHASILMAEDSRLTFDFERDVESWRPRAESIQVSHEKPGAADSAGCLRVQGRIEEGWNYAASDPQPILPGRLYRLTAQVRVDKLGPETPPPYLKCEFVGSARRSSLGQVHTTPYDASRWGDWQQLFGLGIVYDWCYADLDEATRKTIRETIVRRGPASTTRCWSTAGVSWAKASSGSRARCLWRSRHGRGSCEPSRHQRWITSSATPPQPIRRTSGWSDCSDTCCS